MVVSTCYVHTSKSWNTCTMQPWCISSFLEIVTKVRSWTRRLREIRAVGGPEVGGKRVGVEHRTVGVVAGRTVGVGKDAWGV